jgi:hypothetical protein
MNNMLLLACARGILQVLGTISNKGTPSREMQAFAHPQLPRTHVVLDVSRTRTARVLRARDCPRLFRMLTEMTCNQAARRRRRLPVAPTPCSGVTPWGGS